MRVALQDIQEATKELTFEEPTGELNPLLERGAVCDYRFSAPVEVHLRCYRAGLEVFFSGEIGGRAQGQCARCLEWFDLDLVAPFSFVYVPRSSSDFAPEQDETDAEIDLGYYEGNEVDLSPMLRERLLLSLPTLPFCGEGCRGLCPRCGDNLNLGPCGCPAAAGDPRLAVLRGLRVKD
jgi:DUF177 domain-containing protein